MDQEISKGTWVGATLLAIVAILGLSFAVYGIARSLVNNSSADFVSTVDEVGSSSFTDFDGTTVSGLQVRAAIDTFEGQKVAILVNTAAVQQAIAGGTNQQFTGAAIDFTDLARAEIIDNQYNQAIIKDGIVYIAYNAMLDYGSSGTSLTDSKEGHWIWNGPFKLRDGTSNLLFNTTKINYKTTGCSEFIANGSNFTSRLIKDASGTEVGIVFTQVY